MSIRRVRWHSAAMPPPKATGKSSSGQDRDRHSRIASGPAPWQPTGQTRSEIPLNRPDHGQGDPSVLDSGYADQANFRGPGSFQETGTVQHCAGDIAPAVTVRSQISHPRLRHKTLRMTGRDGGTVPIREVRVPVKSEAPQTVPAGDGANPRKRLAMKRRRKWASWARSASSSSDWSAAPT